MVSALVRLVVVASAVLAVGCSLVVDPDQVQCEVAEDCAAIMSPDSRCVDNLCTGSIKTDCSEIPWIQENATKVEVTVLAEDLANLAVPGIPMTVCANGDTNCTMGGEVSAPTGPDGRTKLSVNEGFRGRFSLPTENPTQQAPYYVYMNPPPDPTKPDTLEPSVTIIGLGLVGSIANSIGVTHDANQGHLFFGARDCQGEILTGVTVLVESAGPTVEVAYLSINSTPDPTLSESGTGAQGGGAVINIDVGQTGLPQSRTVSAYHNNKKIFQQPLLFAPGVITSTQIVPSSF